MEPDPLNLKRKKPNPKPIKLIGLDILENFTPASVSYTLGLRVYETLAGVKFCLPQKN